MNHAPYAPALPRLQVKDVKIDAEGQRSSEADLARVRAEAEQRRGALEQWCITSYGEAFSSWIHVCAVRLFVESILRYGLPPQVCEAPCCMGAAQQSAACLRLQPCMPACWPACLPAWCCRLCCQVDFVLL